MDRRGEQDPTQYTIIIVGLMFVFIFVLTAIRVTRAHDNAQWSADGGYTGPDGQLCCGEHDCEPVPQGDLTLNSIFGPGAFHLTYTPTGEKINQNKIIIIFNFI